MVKPATLDGYSDSHTLDCERVLVTLLRGLGPWKESVYLIGGLTPRYLVAARPPQIPPHAGTTDIDLVIDLQILTHTAAYDSLEQNLKKLQFERAENDAGLKLSWRWQTRTEHGARMILDLLADAPDGVGGKVTPLPTDGRISALHIPHASIVFDLHQLTEIRAELLGDNGIAAETIKHANLVGFTCLKALAFEDRNERKDAHDLIYCIEHAPDGIDAVADAFRTQLTGKHGGVIEDCLGILRRRFAGGRRDRWLPQGRASFGRQVRTGRVAGVRRGARPATTPVLRCDRTIARQTGSIAHSQNLVPRRASVRPWSVEGDVPPSSAFELSDSAQRSATQ